ncbi:hypothetical protein Hanom_Chr14g01303061 [Helianthus anomalus]
MGVRTTGPKTCRFSSEFNSAFMASCHLGQSFLCMHSSKVLVVSSGTFTSTGVSFITFCEFSPTALLCSFRFRGFLSLEPIGLPRFRCIVISSGITSIRAGAFDAGTCDFVTLFVSVNASGNSFAILCKCIIFWTSYSH